MDGIRNPLPLETISARTGDLVFKLDGRLLASALDPLREARDWVNRWRSRIAHSDRLIVLGFGCGYHLEALREEWPALRVLAIGAERELFEQLRPRFEMGAVELVLCQRSDDFMVCEPIRRFLRGSFAVVEHSSLPNLDQAHYREIKARLLAREPLFFSDWVRREQRLARLFPLQAIPGGESRHLLSIKDLDRFVHARVDAAPTDIMIVRALRELIK